MEERILVVDGHNAMHAWAGIKPMLGAGKGTTSARAKLISELSAIHHATDWQLVIVFDGTSGGAVVKDDGNRGPKVIYSEGRRSADEVIEGMVMKYGERCRMMVASNDLMVLNAAMAGGADTVSIRGLRELAERADGDFRKHQGKYFRE